jgi:hypothetical protein
MALTPLEAAFWTCFAPILCPSFAQVLSDLPGPGGIRPRGATARERPARRITGVRQEPVRP